MTTTIDIRELSARFVEVIAVATSGGEVLVTDGPAPLARLVPCAGGTPRVRVAGLHPGAMRMAPDFDEPLTFQVDKTLVPPPADESERPEPGDYDDSPWTKDEMQAIAWEAGKALGWEEMDEYDDLPETP